MRDERLQEFAPPQIYENVSVTFQQQRQRSAAHVNKRPQERALFGAKPQPQSDAVSRNVVTDSSRESNIAAVLRSIRSDVEQSEMARSSNHNEVVVTAESRCSVEECNLSDGFLAPVSTTGVDVHNDEQSYDQASSSSFALDFLACAGNIPEQYYGSFPAISSSSDMPSAVTTVSFAASVAENVTGSLNVSSDNSGPQPAHYCSAPAAPQAKKPKYERVFLHDLPSALPLPPVAGSSVVQYPSQEEVIGPKRRKESDELKEKNAIRNWYRQFDQKRPKPVVEMSDNSFEPSNKSQLLKPKNIPFASPYIQTHDASAEVQEDTAIKEFDPSKPPPSVKMDST